MEVRWSPSAEADFIHIIQYVREQNATAADRVARTILDGIVMLEKFPLSGRPGRVLGTREIVFTPLPFLAVYRVRENILEVLRVMHGAQRWP